MTQLTIEPVVESSPVLTVTSLEQTLRAVEPSVVLTPLWLLQNLLVHERGAGGSPFTVSQRRILVIGKEQLRLDAANADLPLPGDLPDTASLILLARPDSDWLARTPSSAALRYYWRLLFRARVDSEFRRVLPDPVHGRAALEKRIERLGRAAYNEAVFVLQRERYLLPGADKRAAYAELATVYFELQCFRPDLISTYFPAVGDHAAALALFQEDVEAEPLLQLTRPPGAAAAVFSIDEPDATADPAEEAAARDDLKQLATRDAKQVPSLLAKAAKATLKGNLTRAAILRMRVFRANRDVDAMQESMQDLEALVQRLKTALGLDEPTSRAWGGALIPLLAHAAGGWWNPEGKLLYDLQKICLNHEREMYSVGVVEWLLELCRRPLRRPQPDQRQVLIIKALRAAISRLPKTRLAGTQRAALDHLLHEAVHHVELRLREKLRPVVVESLGSGGIHPHTNVERVAETKLVEELLDGIVHRGFLTMGNLRDAISRNQVKFHDLRGAVTWLKGDQLLRIDRGLGDKLDGVYHRGEVYLRIFQRLSSLMFATHVGRLLTKLVVMPILGSFLTLEALDHTLFLLARKLTGWEGLTLSHFESEPGHHRSFGGFLTENFPFVLLVVVLLGVLNWPPFRAGVGRVLGIVGRILRGLFYDLPKWVILQPAVQRVVNSREFRLAGRFLFKPAVVAGITWLCLPHTMKRSVRWAIISVVFAAVNLLLNSRAGRALEQAMFHWIRVAWTRVTGDILGNLFRGIMHVFERALEDLDRMLYAVDEWLRFRAGQSRFALVAKASMGVVWFYIAYLTRFVTNLLVEPQINPIKHFPVVTVSHKIVLPTVGVFAKGYEGLGMATVRARTAAGLTVSVIPGIFGFLAWELKENWKLYRANRSQALKPVAVGSHGESMARLLRPGFHSGTVPKIFAKLRRASRRVERPLLTDRARAAAHKQLEHADHVAEAVANFVERELATLLNRHAVFSSSPVTPGEVKLSASRIAIELECKTLDAEPLVFSFEQRAGWIIAAIDHPGWITSASSDQISLLGVALLGFYKLSGVDLIKEHLESLLGGTSTTIEITHDQLLAWPDGAFDTEWVYPLRTEDSEIPAAIVPRGDAAAPKLLLSDLLFRSTLIPWSQWVRVWDGTLTDLQDMKLPAVRVLPPRSMSEPTEQGAPHDTARPVDGSNDPDQPRRGDLHVATGGA